MTPPYQWNRTQILRAIRLSGFYKDIPQKKACMPAEWEKYVKEKK